MLVRSTALAALAAATALAAGGSTATVVLSASDKGVSASTERTDKSQAGATHGQAADHAGQDAEEVTSVTAPECPADVKNHGAYVSSVAKAKAADAEPGEHGALVSAAAQSDCGKDAKGAEGDEGEEEDADAGETSEHAKPDAAGARGGNAAEQGQAGQKLGKAHGKSAEHAPDRSAS
ncbi:MAG TPA: hypothetical protein VF519_11120 [Mycobacteriales bacterium]|jgi:hypothetical protein